MKKLIAILALVSTSAFAQHHNYNHYRGGGNWVAPLIVGGVITYAITRNQLQSEPPVIVQQPVYNNPSMVYNLPSAPYVGAVPLYERRSQFDSRCNCYVVVYNQIGWQ